MIVTAVAVEGLTGLLDDLEHLPEKQREAAVRAINKTADRARTLGDREMRNQVNFKASYLTERLKVVKRAAGRDLSAVVRGRDRPTSLARFDAQQRPGGVRVTVKPGVAKFIKRSFIMKLRAGTNGPLTNRGLAVRTDGGPPKGAYKPIKINDRLWLLYGPAVDQVFRSVRDDISPETAEYLENEFNRLMALEGF